jgi:hypothetical protein
VRVFLDDTTTAIVVVVAATAFVLSSRRHASAPAAAAAAWHLVQNLRRPKKRFFGSEYQGIPELDAVSKRISRLQECFKLSS